jgi:hypothetical protein
MQSRRKFMLLVSGSIAAMGFVVATVFADELIGVMTKVDVEGKKITVVDKESKKDVVIKITDETEQVKKGGDTVKVDLAKLETGLKKVQDAGKEGISITVWHEKHVASKIQMKGRGLGKKAAQ